MQAMQNEIKHLEPLLFRFLKWVPLGVFLIIVSKYLIVDHYYELLEIYRLIFYVHGNVEVNLVLYLLGTLYLAAFPLMQKNKVLVSAFVLIVIVFLFQSAYALFAQFMLSLSENTKGTLDISPLLSVIVLAGLSSSLFFVSLSRKEALLINLSVLISALIAVYQAYAIIRGFTLGH